jgi:hypothetical protein
MIVGWLFCYEVMGLLDTAVLQYLSPAIIRFCIARTVQKEVRVDRWVDGR